MSSVDPVVSDPSSSTSSSSTSSMTATAMSIAEVAATSVAVISEMEKVVFGKREQLEMILMALLANGHVLVDDVPGVAKTLIARSFSQVFGMSFARLQMTPDVLPSDITGSQVLDASRNLVFRPGPVFANLLLADEVNRATPKAQAALLEAMEERQVSADGVTHQLDRPFLVIATQNPVEFEGTYPLPEAQLDRFLLRMKIGYPSADDEWTMVERRLARGRDESTLSSIVSKDQLLSAQRGVERVHVSEPVGKYAVAIVRATRSLPNVSVGSSPRGTLAIVKLARARAAMDARDFVLPDDVKAVAPAALSHRIMLAPEMWVRRRRSGERRTVRSVERAGASGSRRHPAHRVVLVLMRTVYTAPPPPQVALRPLLRALAPLAVVGFVGGFAARQPALVALAAPAVGLLAVAFVRRALQVSFSGGGTLRGAPSADAAGASAASASAGQLDGDVAATGTRATQSMPFPDVWLDLSTPRITAGDDVEITVRLRSSVDIHRCDIAVKMPVGLEVVEGTAALATSLEAGKMFAHTFMVRTSQAGPAVVGPVVVRIDDRSGLFRSERICTGSASLKVVARPDVMQTLLRAAVTGMHVGEQISRSRGDGFEFADMRAYVAGDPAKRIHWRASARTDDPVVIERRLDRNQDVLIVVDAHSNLELGTGDSSLARTMEAAVTIAGAHLSSRDRVGFVGLGSGVSWVVPGAGHTQKYRILDAISSVSTTGEGIGRRVSSVPVTARPRRSLVVVVTPLVDDRSVDVIRDLQARRHDVCVVAVAPFRFVADVGFDRADRDVTLQLWRLLHREERAKLATKGTAVVLWEDGQPVELAVREVMAWRQKLRVGPRQMA